MSYIHPQPDFIPLKASSASNSKGIVGKIANVLKIKNSPSKPDGDNDLSKHSLNLNPSTPVLTEKSSLRYLYDNSSFSSISLSSAPSLSGAGNPVLSLYPGTAHVPNNQSKFWIIEEEDENIIDSNLSNTSGDILDSNIQNRSYNSSPSHFLRSSSQLHNQNNGIASILNNNNSNLSGIVMSSTTTNISATASNANRDYHSYCYGADKTKNNIRQDLRGFSPIHFAQLNNNTNVGLASILPSGSRSLTSTPVHSSTTTKNNGVTAFRSLSPVRGQLTDKGGTHPYIIRNQEFGPAIHFSDKNIFGGNNSRSSTPVNQTLAENIVQTLDIFNPMVKTSNNIVKGKGKGTLHPHPKIPVPASSSHKAQQQPSSSSAHSNVQENSDYSNIGLFYKSPAEKVPLNIKNYMLNIINNYMKGMHVDLKKKDAGIHQYNTNININMKNLFQTIIDYLNDEIDLYHRNKNIITRHWRNDVKQACNFDDYDMKWVNWLLSFERLKNREKVEKIKSVMEEVSENRIKELMQIMEENHKKELEDSNKVYEQKIKEIEQLKENTINILDDELKKIRNQIELTGQEHYEKIKKIENDKKVLMERFNDEIEENKRRFNKEIEVMNKEYKSKLEDLRSQIENYKSQLEELEKERDVLNEQIHELSKEKEEYEM